MIWGWLVAMLFVVVGVVLAWLFVDTRLEQRQERKKVGRRRTAEERLAQAQERKERRRRLGLKDDDKRGLDP